MSDVRSQKDDGLLEHWWPALGQQDVVHASQLDVDLQAEVGQRLWRGPLHVLHLHALRGHPQHCVSHALDLGVHGRLARQDDHHQLQACIRVLQVPEHGLHAVRTLRIFAEARLALDRHAGVSRDLSELLCEGLQMDFCALALGGKARDGPHLDLDARVELLVPHVPDALDRRRNRFIPAPVEDGGRLQHPPSHVRHLIFDHDSKFTDVWICVETCASHQFADLFLPIGADLAVALIMVEV